MPQFSQEIHDQLIKFCREEMIFMGLRRQRERKAIQPTLYLFDLYEETVRVPERNIELAAPLDMDHVRELCDAYTGDLAGYMVVYVGDWLEGGEIDDDGVSIFVPKSTGPVEYSNVGMPTTDKALVGLIEFDETPYTLLSSICGDGSITDVTVSKDERISNFASILNQPARCLN